MSSGQNKIPQFALIANPVQNQQCQLWRMREMTYEEFRMNSEFRSFPMSNSGNTIRRFAAMIDQIQMKVIQSLHRRNMTCQGR
jgi:hypothetical protein